VGLEKGRGEIERSPAPVCRQERYGGDRTGALVGGTAARRGEATSGREEGGHGDARCAGGLLLRETRGYIAVRVAAASDFFWKPRGLSCHGLAPR
jgi:hypothetical protein